MLVLFVILLVTAFITAFKWASWHIKYTDTSVQLARQRSMRYAAASIICSLIGLAIFIVYLNH
jgi:hypothetical protein